MYSSERVQKVVFVRHGVAKHNIPDPTTGKAPNVRDPAMTDPSLVYQGKQQALHAGHRLQQWWQTTQQGNDVELVITSVSCCLSLFLHKSSTFHNLDVKIKTHHCGFPK